MSTSLMQGADLRGLPHLPALPGASAAVKSPQVEVAFPTNVAQIIPLQAPVPLRLRQRKPCPIGEVSSVLSGAQAPAAPSPSETPHVASHCDHHHLREEGDPRRCSFSLRHCCSVAQPCPAFGTPWTAARQASLAISQSLLKLMSVVSVMPSNHLILYHSFLLLPSTSLSIRVCSNESALSIR